MKKLILNLRFAVLLLFLLVGLKGYAQPVANCRNLNLNLNPNGVVSVSATQLNNGSLNGSSYSIMFGGALQSSVTFNCNNVGSNNLILYVTDSQGQQDTCTAVVTVSDTLRPTVICAGTITALIGTNGAAIVSANQIGTSNDICGIQSLLINGSNVHTYSCNNLGQNTATYTAIDNNGNSSSCTTIVNIVDNNNNCSGGTAPVAICANINTYVGNTGSAFVTAPQLNNGSLNASSFLIYNAGSFQTTAFFGCNNIGTNNLILYVSNSQGQQDTCTATVTVIDTTSPTIVCQNNPTFSIGQNGVVVVTGQSVATATDPCGIQNYQINGTSAITFSCNNLGPFTAVFTATDNNGNSSNCLTVINISDPNNNCGNPVSPNAVCQTPLSFPLGLNGTVTVDASQIDGGSTGGQVYLIDGNNYVNSITFNCSNLGTDTVTLVVIRIDSNGTTQISTCTSSLYIYDSNNFCGFNTTQPQANCVNALNLDLASMNGYVMLSPQMLNNGSTNASSMWIMDGNGSYQSAYTFGCNDIGTHQYYLVVSSGNVPGTVNALIDTCSVIVTITDSTNICGGGQGNYTVLDSIFNANCNGVCNGAFALLDIVLANGSIAPRPYTIVWQNNISSSSLITNLCGNTTYTITVYDSLQNPYQHSFYIGCNNVPNPNSCIDSSLINPVANCPTVYSPVCGCNGVTYINSCIAQNSAGVTAWTNGPCGGNSGSINYTVQTTGSGCDSSCTGSITISFPTATPNNTYTLVWNDGFSQTGSGTPALGAVFVRNNLCAGVYVATVSTNTFSAPFSITAIVGTAQGCVWPGDADDNTTVNNWDLLPIALTHGESGILRPNANISWTGQASSDWTTVNPVAGLPNYKHIDCNGDGIINQNDLTAIQQNYGSSYYRSNSSMTGNIPFFINSVNANEGDRLSLPINLGTAAEPAADVYGVAFTLNYDPEIVEASSVSVDYPVSWLGTNLLDIQYDFSQLGKIEVAVARRDRLNNSGFGEIGKFNFTIRDDILRSSTTRTMDIDITNIRLINNANAEIGTNPQVGTVTVTLLSATEAIDNYSVELFPNPAKDQFNVRVQNASLETVTVYNVNGQLVKLTENINSNILTLPVNELARGIYMVQIKTDKGVENRKLVIE
jgi:hypothetical protein